MIRVSKCVGNTAVVVQSTILLQLFVARMMWTYKVDANLVLGENSKEPSTSTILAEASFDDDVNKKALNRNKFLLIIIEKKLDINYIQTLPAQIQQNMLRKILGNAFITEKCTQCKTPHTLKIDVFELLDNKNIGNLF